MRQSKAAAVFDMTRILRGRIIARRSGLSLHEQITSSWSTSEGRLIVHCVHMTGSQHSAEGCNLARRRNRRARHAGADDLSERSGRVREREGLQQQRARLVEAKSIGRRTKSGCSCQLFSSQTRFF